MSNIPHLNETVDAGPNHQFLTNYCFPRHPLGCEQVFVPLVNTLTGKGIKLITMVAACLAITGTSFLELGGAKPSLNDLWCVVQSFGFGVSFTRIEVSLGASTAATCLCGTSWPGDDEYCSRMGRG